MAGRARLTCTAVVALATGSRARALLELLHVEDAARGPKALARLRLLCSGCGHPLPRRRCLLRRPLPPFGQRHPTPRRAAACNRRPRPHAIALPPSRSTRPGPHRWGQRSAGAAGCDLGNPRPSQPKSGTTRRTSSRFLRGPAVRGPRTSELDVRGQSDCLFRFFDSILDE